MKKRCHAALFSLTLPLLAAGLRTYKPGSPLEHLPNNIELVSEFGERPDFSPDNKSLAFMGKSFGDAFVMDLATRRIRCLTCDILGAAFLRVMHLPSGDYIRRDVLRGRALHTTRSICRNAPARASSVRYTPVRRTTAVSSLAAGL